MRQHDPQGIGSIPATRREFLAGLVARVDRSGLHFRTHAAVAAQLLRALEAPETSMTSVTHLVQAEPLLAARLVAVANALTFNASGRVTADLRGAVTRLGLNNVRALATAFLVRQMSESSPSFPPALLRMARQLWEHTAHVAALAHVLAHRVTRVDPEAALFAGIVHEVGGFYLLSHAAEHAGLFEGEAPEADGAAEMELLVELNRKVARALCVPEPAMAALEDLWSGFLAIPPRTLGDTLLLAEELAPVASPFCGIGGASGPQASFEIILDAGTLSGILAESTNEVLSLADALGH